MSYRAVAYTMMKVGLQTRKRQLPKSSLSKQDYFSFHSCMERQVWRISVIGLDIHQEARY